MLILPANTIPQLKTPLSSRKYDIIKHQRKVMIMGTKIKYTSSQKEELQNARTKNKNKNIDKRLHAILLHAEGTSNKEISKKTGFAESYISELAGKYRRNGIDAIAGNHYKGNRRNIGYDEEKTLIESIKEKAKKGQMTTVREFKAMYEKATGKIYGESNKGQIYRVLKRHNGRKVMPRSTHPKKASPEVIEASKKLT